MGIFFMKIMKHLRMAPSTIVIRNLIAVHLPDLLNGFNFINNLGYDAIGMRVELLTKVGLILTLLWLIEHLTSLKHNTGQPLIKIIGPEDTTERGGTIAHIFYDKNGTLQA